MKNIFDQYTQPENKLTHSLVSCLYEDKKLLNSFLKYFCKSFFNNLTNIEIEEQTLPNDQYTTEDEEDSKGLPDAVIYNEDRCLIIESKVSSRLNRDQLIRHERTVKRRGFEVILGIGIVVDIVPHVKLNNWKQITWNEVYSWAHKEKNKSDWAIKLTDYFRVLEHNMVEKEYLKDGSITEFTGVHFDKDTPYTYREGKRQLKLIVNKIRENNDLKRYLNIDLKKKGRSGIKKAGNVWDYLTFNTGVKDKSFTDEPHLTVGLNHDFIEADLTIPYRIKGRTKKNFYSLSWDDFKNMIYTVALNYNKTFGNSNGYKPQIVMAQRRYPSQSSPAIHDAKLEFDIRTAFKDISSDLKPKQKYQEEWLKLVFELNNNKRSNLQFQLGARFFYNKDTFVNNKDADKVLIKSFISCKPFIDYLFS
ncbi:PD-(D/E)XK nuclease family protein [Alphaproteobacteria bacterium]|nr:PD-(D/E)XK nuclease family protein [Alphaproteobacteria bacterium]